MPQSVQVDSVSKKKRTLSNMPYDFTTLKELADQAEWSPLSELEESRDHKRCGMFNDEELAVEFDTDDVSDPKKIHVSANFLRELWNSWPEIKKLL